MTPEENVAAIVGNIPVGTEIMKNGTAATLIDYGKKLDAYANTIEDLQKKLKMEVATVDHLDDTLTKRIVDLNGTVKELRNERDEYKESIGLERVDCRAQMKAVNQFHHKTIDSLKKDIDDLKAEKDKLYHEITVDDQTIDEQKTFINRLLYSNKEFNIVLDNVRGDVKDTKEQLEAEVCEVERLRFVVGREHTECKKLQQRIDEKDMLIECLEIDLTASRNLEIRLCRDVHDISANYQGHNAHLKERIKGLEDKLSAYKQDSEVLKKVVDIIKDDSIRIHEIPYRIMITVDDYIDGDE